MRFMVLKSGFDGISGSSSKYESVDEVLREISYYKGWDSREQLHDAIRNWADHADPGSVFTTQASAIVAAAESRHKFDDNQCPYCDHEGLDYEEMSPVECGDIEQAVECPECGERWVEVFIFHERRKQTPRKPKRGSGAKKKARNKAEG